jgi:hypothetical protein
MRKNSHAKFTKRTPAGREQGASSMCLALPVASIPIEKKYTRCYQKGCDEYDMKLVRSGEYALIEVSGRGMLAKINTAGSFMEVVTLMDQALISYGTCK